MSSSMLPTPTLGLLALLSSKAVHRFALSNVIAQLAVFVPLSHIPAVLTGRMSYVDIAWPAGLVAIAIQAKAFSGSGGNPVRQNAIFLAYLFQGGRMLLGAIFLAWKGHLKAELQRYMYQRRRWERKGITESKTPLKFKATMQLEIFIQALANMGVLCVPAALQSSSINRDPLSSVELVGWAVWLAGFVVEHTADVQKLRFAAKCKAEGVRKAVCDVGLWRYSRHPNYFGEWMVWNGLVISSLPTLLKLLKGGGGGDDTEGGGGGEAWYTLAGLTGALFGCSYAMYKCLTGYTGAVPSEFYSAQTRPDYKRYQEEVSMFIPSARRRRRSSSSSSRPKQG